jgi:hypothetical protein
LAKHGTVQLDLLLSFSELAPETRPSEVPRRDEFRGIAVSVIMARASGVQSADEVRPIDQLGFKAAGANL